MDGRQGQQMCSNSDQSFTAPPSIDAIQHQLEQRFVLMRGVGKLQRRSIFALEHGMDRLERASLELALRDALRGPGYRPSRHWLAWTVYACELAYADDGTDYWHRLESSMPGWSVNWRTGLRQWFEDFSIEFGGYRPVGRWAETYSIISWPLCHAVLPRDLHWQLTRTLCELRHQFPTRKGFGATALGHFIACRNKGGSSRFENLLEESELVGLLARSLISEPADGSRLCDMAVDRILADMQADKMTHPWLYRAADATGPGF